MKKLILFSLIAISVFTYMPIAFADSTYGTVTDITESTGDSLTKGKGTIETKGDTTTIRYSSSTFKMLPADKSAGDGGRPGPAAWIGFKIVEPDGGNSQFKVTTPDNNTTLIKKNSYQDYVGITPENLKKALLNNTNLIYRYSFDWNEDDKSDQYVIIEIDPKGTTLIAVDSTDEVWTPEIAQKVLSENEKNPETSDINISSILFITIISILGVGYCLKKKLN